MKQQLNIFDTLTSRYKQPDTANSATEQPVQQAVNKPDYASMPLADLVDMWNKDRKEDARDAMLKRLQPTIDSAMNTYAPGMKDRLSVKAARLTLDAMSTFKKDKGADPRTYLFHSLHRLSRYNADSGSILKEPESVRYDRNMVQQYIDKFKDIHDREPSLSELADKTGLSVKRLDYILNDAGRVVSESSTLSEDSLKDRLSKSDLNDDDYFEYVYASVSPVDQKIMEWSSGLHGKKQLSTNEIAAKLHLSAAAISQRKNKIQQYMSEVRGIL